MFKGTIGIIGAREGSVRIPQKNIKLLGGMHLICYSLDIFENWSFINKTIVSTDSKEIAEIASSYFKAKVITRPSELARNNSTDYEWILHLLKDFYNKKGFYPEFLVFLRPTTPIRKLSIVEEAYYSFINSSDDSLRSIEPLAEAIEKTFRLNENNILYPSCSEIKIEDTNKPNQSFPITYKANGYVDILRSEYILNHKDLYGNRIRGFITPRTIELDTLEDWEEAEYFLRKGKHDK